MSQVYICVVCNGIYNSKRIKKNKDGVAYCPNIKTKCGSNMFKVDENLAEIVLSIWNYGLETVSCCEGHPWDIGGSPYISFGESKYRSYNIDLENIRDIFLKINEENDNFFRISSIRELELRDSASWYNGYIEYKEFSVRPDIERDDFDKFTLVDKLQLKIDFINMMYLFINELDTIIKL